MAMTLDELQEQAKEVASLFPNTTMEQRVMFLVTEVGEMAAEALVLSGAHGDADVEEAKRKLGLEMYDVLWNLCDLANMLGIDLDSACRRKIAYNRARVWEEAARSA
jgi:NTP pyrophosphatase (non-canonical NTP hydrolase)